MEEDNVLIPKQKRWFRTDVNFERSFKFWFALQWQNKYIQIFAVSFSILIYQFCNLTDQLGYIMEAWSDNVGVGLMVTMGMLLPLIVSSAVVYKGFWQYFNDLGNNRSR